MASVWVNLVFAQAAAPPSTTPASPCYLYSRDLPTTVWGFLITLVALTVDSWGSWKNENTSTFGRILYVCVFGTLNPFSFLILRMQSLVSRMRLMQRLSGVPSAKPYIKILSTSEVVVNISQAASQRLEYSYAFAYDVNVEDFSDALVIGRPVHPENRLRLSDEGKEALIRADILPPVEQLTVLQGYSGLAMAASAIQGVGYMYGIVVRLVQGLHVSPLEATGFIMNYIVLVKALLHLYTSSCHKPLLFLEADEEAKFVTMCEAPDRASWNLTTIEWLYYIIWIVIVSAVLPGSFLTYFIIQIARATSWTTTMPLIVIGVGTVVLTCAFFRFPHAVHQDFKEETLVHAVVGTGGYSLIPILNFVGYVTD